MADNGVDCKITISSETGGADEARSKIETLPGSLTKLLAPIKAVRSAIGGLFSAMGTVGFVINGWNQWIDTVKSFREWLHRAQKAAFELMKNMQNARFADGLEKAGSKASYLKNELAKALEKMDKMRKYEADFTIGRNEIEDAKTELAEQRALSGTKDDEERARISEDFEIKRAETAWRRAYVAALDEKESIGGKVKALKDSNWQEERFRKDTYERLQDVRFWLRDGRLTEEERAQRYRLAEALEGEITKSKKRSRANEELIEDLLRQKTLLDAGVEAAKTNYETKKEEVSRDRGDRARKKEEERIKEEKKAAEAYAKERKRLQERAVRQELQRRINAARKELQTRQSAASDAAQRYSDAKGEVRDAQNNFSSTMTVAGRRDLRKEERRAAKEERRFQSRLAKLKAKYGDDLGPTAFSDEGLSISEKATRRLAFARANEKAAKREAERTAKAAEECEKHLAKLAEQVEVGGD